MSAKDERYPWGSCPVVCGELPALPRLCPRRQAARRDALEIQPASRSRALGSAARREYLRSPVVFGPGSPGGAHRKRQLAGLGLPQPTHRSSHTLPAPAHTLCFIGRFLSSPAPTGFFLSFKLTFS